MKIYKESEFFTHYWSEPASWNNNRYDIFGNKRPKKFDYALFKRGVKRPVFVRKFTIYGVSYWKYLGPNNRWKLLRYPCVTYALPNIEEVREE